jgi:hypothetical protein
MSVRTLTLNDDPEQVLQDLNAAFDGTTQTDLKAKSLSGGAVAATTISASEQIISTVETGTAPLVVTSTTEVANLKAAMATDSDTLDNYHADDLKILNNSVIVTSTISTSSTSYVEISSLTQTKTLTNPCSALVLFMTNGNVDTSGRSLDVKLQVDGVDKNESRFTSATANSTGNLTNMSLVTLDAGSHTFKVFWKVTDGTGYMHTRQLFVIFFPS